MVVGYSVDGDYARHRDNNKMKSRLQPCTKKERKRGRVRKQNRGKKRFTRIGRGGWGTLLTMK